MADDERLARWRQLEPGRMVLGAVAEVAIKAYGAGAALAVALSDAETVGGKLKDAAAAVPTLVDEFRRTRYVVENREEIQSAVDYLNTHTIPQEELEASARESAATLDSIDTTYDELTAARDAFTDGRLPNFGEVKDHLGAAWDAKPDLGSIQRLSEVAEQVGPYVDQVDALIPAYYGGLLRLMDNFASDEIVATIGVMVLAYALAALLGRCVAYVVRRGRPGIVAQLLQRLGARHFRPWYVDNLPHALTPSLYDAARERIQRDIVRDPQEALDPDALRDLERWFAARASGPPASPEGS